MVEIKDTGGIELAVKSSISRAACPSEFISVHLLKITLELRGRATAVTFIVAYVPADA